MAINRIQEFLAQLEKITLFGEKKSYTTEQLKSNMVTVNKLCKIELNYLRKHAKLTTLRSICTDYRNAVKLHFNSNEMALTHKPKGGDAVCHIALKYFKLKKTEVDTYTEAAKEAKQRNLSGFGMVLIANENKLIKKAVNMLDSDRFYEIALGLIILTGRRPIEILRTGNFKVVSKNKVLFSGQAKVPFGHERSAYEIYTLCDSKLICKALKKLRDFDKFANLKVNLEKVKNENPDFIAHYKYKTINEKIDSNASGALGIEVRKALLNEGFFFFSNDGSVTNLRECEFIETKMLRGVYAHIANDKFAPIMETNLFAKSMLGHVDDVTASHYMKCMLLKKLL